MSDTKTQLRKVRREREKLDKVRGELEESMLVAHAAGFPIRAIADASGFGHSSVHRLIVRSRS